jgi:hypothetical protein
VLRWQNWKSLTTAAMRAVYYETGIVAENENAPTSLPPE